MAVKTRLLCVGLALLCTGLLATACQNDDPDPIPSAVLPTPPTPSGSSPSETKSTTQQALDVYVDGHNAFEARSTDGGSDDAQAEMSEYYSGAYLDLQVQTLRQIYNDGLTQNGQAELVAIIDPVDPVAEDATNFEFTACIDFSSVQVTTSEGEILDRGFEVSQDFVTMTLKAGDWTASDVRSQVSDQFTGTCDEVAKQ